MQPMGRCYDVTTVYPCIFVRIRLLWESRHLSVVRINTTSVPKMMDTVWLKVLFMGALFTLAMICCLSPTIILRKRSLDDSSYGNSGICKNVLSLCNCVASGVFMAMCFLDLLPYVKDQVDTVLNNLTIVTNFPIAESVVVMGFFLILTIEQTLTGLRSMSSNKSTRSSSEEVLELDDHDLRSPLLEADEIELYNAQDPSTLMNNVVDNSKSSGPGNGSLHQHHDCHGGHHSHQEVLKMMGSDRGPGLVSVVMLFALSVHGIFEGIALGLQTQFSKLIHMFIAIALHESVCAVALGLSVARTRPSACKAFRYSLVLCSSIPLGMVIGMAVVGQTHGVSGHVISALLQGLAAGIFLHITFVQMIPREFAEESHGLLKVLFLFVGFLFMVVIKMLAKEGE